MRFRLAALVFLATLAIAGSAVAAGPGRYIGDVVAKWLDDGRVMELQNDFRYVDPSDREWLAPKGSKIDGASIPPAAWSIIGGPFEGKYRNASVIHDVACERKDRPWQEVHRVFYDAMLTSGVSTLKAKTMYAAVLLGGPKWSRHVAFHNVPYGQAQNKAFSVATTQTMSGETASTRIVLGSTTPQSSTDYAIFRPDLPPKLATVEVAFEPQPSVHLTEDQVRALEKEIETQNLSVEQIEQKYLISPPNR